MLVNPRNINFTSNFPPPRPNHHANAATGTSSIAAMIHFLRRPVILHVAAPQAGVNPLRRYSQSIGRDVSGARSVIGPSFTQISVGEEKILWAIHCNGLLSVDSPLSLSRSLKPCRW